MRKARQNDGRAIDERDRRARLDEIRESKSSGRGRGRGRGGRGGGPGRGVVVYPRRIHSTTQHYDTTGCYDLDTSIMMESQDLKR